MHSKVIKVKLVLDALKKVVDPEIGMNIIDVGLIYGIEIDQSNSVYIKMTLTTPGCPLKDYFISEIETVLMDVDFVTDVQVEFVWSPPWDLSMMDEDAKLNLFQFMRG
ncbi:MAG: hypothetical protein KatS3mg084_0060 [Candidatus Dojkabacteria bacterium]|nr:MAG: hypothetical protein KatS3mg084_0060 [Candidatus Dojkabacteria bacterium]